MKKIFLLFLLIFSLSVLGCEQKRKFLSIGDNAPNFFLLDLYGNTISLSDILKDKEVILSFWASWCSECRQQMPILNGLAKKYRERIEIIGVNIKEAKKTVLPFIKDIGIEYIILLDTQGQIAKLYGVAGVPTNVLINKEGLIKNLNLDVRGMESYLRKE